MPKGIVFVDVDGVLANFTKRVLKKWKIEVPKKAHIDSFKLDVIYKKTKKEFYKTCDGHGFWAEMDIYPWAQSLIELVDEKTKGNWRFLTSPMRNKGCYSGKADWILKHFPKHFSKLIVLGLGGGKSESCQLRKAILCRSKNDYLIDDSEKNLNPWEQQGGNFFFWKEITEDFDPKEIEKRFDKISEDLSP